jgi:hypothetical protein
MDDSDRGELIAIASKIKMPQLLDDLVKKTDFRKIHQIRILLMILASIEGLGFHDSEKIIIEQGLSVEPDNQIFIEAQRRLDQSFSRVFSAPTLNPDNVRRSISVHRRFEEFGRALLFWR